jgi:hypothetical protein
MVVVAWAVATRSVAGLEVEACVGVAVGEGEAVVGVIGGGIGVASACSLVIGVACSCAVFCVRGVDV